MIGRELEQLVDAVLDAVKELSDARAEEAELLERDPYCRLDGHPTVVDRKNAEDRLRTAIVALIDSRVAEVLDKREAEQAAGAP